MDVGCGHALSASLEKMLALAVLNLLLIVKLLPAHTPASPAPRVISILFALGEHLKPLPRRALCALKCMLCFYV